MGFNSFNKPQVQPEGDELQKLLCGVQGCYKRWCVHTSGTTPLCAAHRNYFDDKGDYIRNPYRLASPEFVKIDKFLDF